MSVDWRAFAELVRNHESYLLTTHIRPDCDALGSCLGMAGILEALGKRVEIVNGHPTPPNLAFIDPENRVKALGEDVAAADVPPTDVLMVLDTSAWAQLGPMGDVLRATKARRVVVDHHVSEDDLAAEPFKDVTAAATGCLVAQAAEHLGVELTPEIARPLFAAIATDTGWYRFNSTDGETMRIAARLIDAGASPADIYASLYEQDTLGRVKLRGLILSRVTAELEGRLVHTYVSRDDFAATGAVPTDTEDVVNMALAVAGSQAAIIFVEQKNGGFKISFRSRCDLDCSELAAQFGGGGHKAAAGAFIEGELDAVRDRVLDAARAAMR